MLRKIKLDWTKSYFSSIIGVAFILLLIPIPTAALQCSDAPIDITATARATQNTTSTITKDCTLEGEQAIHLAGKLESSLVQARGYIEILFFDLHGKLLWSTKQGPWLGAFSDLKLEESIAVPPGAVRTHIAARVENNRKEAAGKWRIVSLMVSPGTVVVGEAEEGSVISASQDATWRFSTVPTGRQGEFQIQLCNATGRTVVERVIRKTGPQTRINFGKLPVGYYKTIVRFNPEQGHTGLWTSALAVLPDNIPPNEPRFGMDAALSWYGGTPEMVSRSVNMMRQAGIGTVRDRLKWSQVQPTRHSVNWGRYEEVAKAISQAGMESVQVFHDSPHWTRPGSSTQTSVQPPFDNIAVFEFGQIYAKGLGKIVRNIEYWNEQNSDFFPGFPFQYTNGLKAFSAGIKSIDPNIRVLIGSASGQPGRFFEEIYRNGAVNFFDVRNQHFYGKNADLDSFFDKHIAALERNGNVAAFPGWVTEMGFSLHRDQHGNMQTAEQDQAEYLIKAYAIGFATGYERVFFFFWRELIEAEHHTWGIVREDFSPRPAYLALALLTRHLAGASIVAIERHKTGRTVYFHRKNEAYLAVSWGDRAAINRLGTGIEIRNIYGQLLNSTSPEINDSSPLLLSRIQRLPDQAQQINLPKQHLHTPPPFRLDAHLRINGKDQKYLSNNQIAASVGEEEAVEIIVHAYSSNSEASKLIVDCIPGPGLTLLSPTQLTLERPKPTGEVFTCRFQAKLAMVGESHVTVQARNTQSSDIVRVALIPDATSITTTATARPLMPDGKCPRWIPRHSSNLALQIEPLQDATERCQVSVTSNLNHIGNTWVFPAILIPMNEFSTAIGLRLQITNVPGWLSPPKPFLLQLVEKNGRIWLVELQRDGDSTLYSGLFNLAHAAPWGRSGNGSLDLGNVREIMVGWGGHPGKVGQRYGFMISAIAVLQNTPDTR